MSRPRTSSQRAPARALSQRREGTRARLVSSAARVLNRTGFRHITMDEVCEQIGTSKKTLYQYFRTKDELVEAVVDVHTRELGDAISGVGDVPAMDPLTALSRLHALLAAPVQERMDAPLARDLRVIRPDLWERFEAERGSLVRRLEQVLRAGQRTGLFRRELDARIVMLMLQSVIDGLLSPEALAKHALAGEEARRTVLDVFTGGLLVRAPAKRGAKRSP